MPDRVFFPLIATIAAFMILVAMKPAEGICEPRGPIGGADTDYTTITVEKCNLNRIIAGGEAAMGLLQRDGESFLKIESYVDVQQDDPLKGPHFELDSDLERSFSDHDLEVTLTARPSSRKGARAFQAN